MASTSTRVFISEGASTNKPPSFDKRNYYYCKEKIKAKMGMRVVVITRRDLINENYLSNRNIAGRLIPKRGQVKLGIVVGLFHRVSSVFSSITTRCVHLSWFLSFFNNFCYHYGGIVVGDPERKDHQQLKGRRSFCLKIELLLFCELLKQLYISHN